MSLISYAQNFEDVMLWRALKYIENGFYIDIGAQDPVVDSVSLAFYEHGWRGVHVEPTFQYSDKIKKARSNEIVEQIAIGDQDGHLDFYEFSDTGLSTANPQIAKQHISNGHCAIKRKIQFVTLDELLERYEKRTIHWLKIDVEGMEGSILKSWKINSCRPWILIIESTMPLTQEDNHEEWENIILEKGYVFAYFDGLNRFYVHSDNLNLLPAFRYPPNIFDDFCLSGLASQPFYKLIGQRAEQAESRAEQAESRAEQAESRAVQAESRAAQAESRAEQAENRAAQEKIKADLALSETKKAYSKAKKAEAISENAHAVLAAIYNSHSWRITAPLRRISDAIRKFAYLSSAWVTFANNSRPGRILRNFFERKND